jgi:small subunit ribosomal protein S17
MADSGQRELQTGQRAQKVGTVVSTKMNKTIVVEVRRRMTHRLYRRIVTRRKKFYAHDEKEVARLGDEVRIVECRPLSKSKRWRLATVIRQAAAADEESPKTRAGAGRGEQKSK